MSHTNIAGKKISPPPNRLAPLAQQKKKKTDSSSIQCSAWTSTTRVDLTLPHECTFTIACELQPTSPTTSLRPLTSPRRGLQPSGIKLILRSLLHWFCFFRRKWRERERETVASSFSLAKPRLLWRGTVAAKWRDERRGCWEFVLEVCLGSLPEISRLEMVL